MDLLNEYNDRIKSIYNEYGLDCINRLDDSHKIHDKQMLSWHSDISRRCQIANKMHFDYFKNYDDISYCSDEILYFTAHLFLYRPYMNNPIDDSIWFSTRMIYPNYVNLGTKRYYMFADIVLEKLYNYWDRIGDLIASYFPELISERRVYFTTALDIIPNEYRELDSFKWLSEFRNNSYKDLNNKRRQVVHYTTSITRDKHNHLNLSNEEEVIAWQKERNGLADYFNEQIHITLEGFYQTLLLLEEVDKTKYKNVIFPK